MNFPRYVRMGGTQVHPSAHAQNTRTCNKVLPNVNVIKRLAQTSEAQAPTDMSQSWTNFLIGLFGIAGSEPVADAMAVDANQLAW